MPNIYHIRIPKKKIQREQRRYLFKGMGIVGDLRDSQINDSILLNLALNNFTI